jgi:predicted nucleotidyltransferase
MAANEIERKLEEKKAYMSGVFHIREIGIFGSFIT